MRKFPFTFLAALFLCGAAISSVTIPDLGLVAIMFGMCICASCSCLILANVPPSKPTY